MSVFRRENKSYGKTNSSLVDTENGTRKKKKANSICYVIYILSSPLVLN